MNLIMYECVCLSVHAFVFVRLGGQRWLMLSCWRGNDGEDEKQKQAAFSAGHKNLCVLHTRSVFI